MIKIRNPYDQAVQVSILRADGTPDGVHVQPGATLTLPGNTQVAADTRLKYPKLRITDDTPVGIPLVSEFVPDAVVEQPVVADKSNVKGA